MQHKHELTAFEKVLRSLPTGIALDALAIIEKISRKILQQPGEEKWRRLSKFNARLLPILGNKAGLNIMKEIGWQVEKDFLVLPHWVTLEFQQHVTKIIEARHYYKEELITKRLQKRTREMFPERADSSGSSLTTCAEFWKPPSRQPSSTNLAGFLGSRASTVVPSSDDRLHSVRTENSPLTLSEVGLSTSQLFPFPSAEERDLRADLEARMQRTRWEAPEASQKQAQQRLTDELFPPPAAEAHSMIESAASLVEPEPEAPPMACSKGHTLQWKRLKPHQGWIHRRECNLCGSEIAREAVRLRCEDCRLNRCAFGCNRDTYSVCAGCTQFGGNLGEDAQDTNDDNEREQDQRTNPKAQVNTAEFDLWAWPL